MKRPPCCAQAVVAPAGAFEGGCPVFPGLTAQATRCRYWRSGAEAPPDVVIDPAGAGRLCAGFYRMLLKAVGCVRAALLFTTCRHSEIIKVTEADE